MSIAKTGPDVFLDLLFSKHAKILKNLMKPELGNSVQYNEDPTTILSLLATRI